MDRQKLKELDIRQFNMMALMLIRDDAVTDINLAVRRWRTNKRVAQALATMGIAELEMVAARLPDPICHYAGTPSLELLFSQVKAGEPDESLLISQMAHVASGSTKTE